MLVDNGLREVRGVGDGERAGVKIACVACLDGKAIGADQARAREANSASVERLTV
ncbi:hypothetical protein D3C85_1895880 [compost metagenome]